MFVDPEGESFILAMALGASLNAMMNASNINSFPDFAKYAGIGALSGAIGYGLSPGVLINRIPVGVAEGFAWGSGAGGITGGINSSLNSGSFDSFGSGFVTGAIFGGIGGGIQGYSLAKSIGHNPWTGSAPIQKFNSIRYKAQLFSPNFKSSRLQSPFYNAQAPPMIEASIIEESTESTISSFRTIDGSVSGYFLEPTSGTTQQMTTEGSGVRILRGLYRLGTHSGGNHPGVPELLNVTGRSNILIHTGNRATHTAGCLLPGVSYDTNWVGNTSVRAYNQLTNWIENQFGYVYIRLR
jgi:hypothetical protein